MRKVRFTQKQIEECLRRSIEEQTYYVNDGQNQSPSQIASKAKTENPGSGPDDSVVTPADSVAGGTSIPDVNGTMLQIPLKENSYTKKQIKEAKLKYLKENSYSVRKKDLK